MSHSTRREPANSAKLCCSPFEFVRNGFANFIGHLVTKSSNLGPANGVNVQFWWVRGLKSLDVWRISGAFKMWFCFNISLLTAFQETRGMWEQPFATLGLHMFKQKLDQRTSFLVWDVSFFHILCQSWMTFFSVILTQIQGLQFIKCFFGNQPLEIISGVKHFGQSYNPRRSACNEAIDQDLLYWLNMIPIVLQHSPALVPKLGIYSHVFCIPRSGTTSNQLGTRSYWCINIYLYNVSCRHASTTVNCQHRFQ